MYADLKDLSAYAGYNVVNRKVIKEWKIIASRGGYVRNHLNRTVIK